MQIRERETSFTKAEGYFNTCRSNPQKWVCSKSVLNFVSQPLRESSSPHRWVPEQDSNTARWQTFVPHFLARVGSQQRVLTCQMLLKYVSFKITSQVKLGAKCFLSNPNTNLSLPAGFLKELSQLLSDHRILG